MLTELGDGNERSFWAFKMATDSQSVTVSWAGPTKKGATDLSPRGWSAGSISQEDRQTLTHRARRPVSIH